MADDRNLRVNLQTNQRFEGNEVNDGNGWPVPLCDPSSPLKMAVTNGGNGEQRNFDPVATMGQDQLSLAEGKVGVSTLHSQGGHDDKFKTSQMNPPNHSAPEGE